MLAKIYESLSAIWAPKAVSSPYPRVVLRTHPSLSVETHQALFKAVAQCVEFDPNSDQHEVTLDRDFYTRSTERKIRSIAESCEYLINIGLKDKAIELPRNCRHTQLSQAELRREMIALIRAHQKRALKVMQDIKSSATLSVNVSVCETTLTDYAQQMLGLICKSYNLPKKQACHLIDRADSFRVLQIPRRQFVTVIPVPGIEPGTMMDDCYAILMDKPMSCLSRKMAQEYLDFITDKQRPDWVGVMSIEEQHMLRHELEGVSSVDDVLERIVNVSSRLRIMPVLPNAYVHQCYIVKNGETKLINQEGSSALISSRELIRAKASKGVQEQHALHNAQVQIFHQFKLCAKNYIEQFGEDDPIEIPVLFQTMISPYLGMIDRACYQLKLEACKQLLDGMADGVSIRLDDGRQVKVVPKVFETNHPVNYAKWLHGLYGVKSDTNRLLKYAREQLQTGKFNDEKDDVLKLISAIEEDMEVNIDFQKETNQSLMLNSHEQLLVQKLGGMSIGSCFSGKDRKRTEMKNTDGEAIYHEIDPRKTYPRFHKESDSRTLFFSRAVDPESLKRRNHYHRVFAEISCSRHHQLLAGENAEGADGTKNIGIYLGKQGQYERAIHEAYQRILGDEVKPIEIFNCENTIAGRNEMKRLCKIKTTSLDDMTSAYKQFGLHVLVAHKKSQVIGQKQSPIMARLIAYLRQMQASASNPLIKEIVTQFAMLTKESGKQGKNRVYFYFQALSKIDAIIKNRVLNTPQLTDETLDFYRNVLSYIEPILSHHFRELAMNESKQPVRRCLYTDVQEQQMQRTLSMV